MKTNQLSGENLPPHTEPGGKHSHSTLVKSAAAVLLLLLAAALFCGAAGAAQGPFPDDGILIDGTTYTLSAQTTLTKNLILSSGNVTIDLNGYSLKGNADSPVITIEGGTLTLNDSSSNGMGNIAGDTSIILQHDGGCVYVRSGGQFIMEGGTIRNFRCLDINTHTGHNGGGVYVKGGTFTMNGGTIRSNWAHSGGGVYLDDGTFTMNGGTIETNQAEYRGGGVYVNSGSFTMENDAKIQTNSAGQSIADAGDHDANGGGVFVTSSGRFTMDGGTISGNTVSSMESGVSGGGVCNHGIFIMNDGTISGNNASGAQGNPSAYGGGVFTSGTFEMNGGTISNNKADVDNGVNSNGGGVYVYGTFNVSGSAKIFGNTNQWGGQEEVTNNVFLRSAAKLTLAGSLTEGADIRISQVDGASIAAGQPFGCVKEGVTVTAADAAHIKDDEGKLCGTVKDGKLIWTAVNGLTRYNGKIFNKDTIIGGGGSPFNAENASYDRNTNTLTLKDDVTLTSGTLEIIAAESRTPFTLDLSEKTLTGNGSAPVITVAKNAELTITGGSGKITGGSSGILVGGRLTLNGGHITGNNAEWGGGVCVAAGEFTMNKGYIDTNTAKNGGGVCVFDGGKFTINNGYIYSNTAENGNGGGVYICNGGTFEMKDGGALYGNSANNGNGGGVYVEEKGTFKITSSGALYYNTAKNGAGVYNTGTFTMNGGSIYNNNNFFLFPSNATENGGGVYNSGTFTMTGGSIFSNKANSGAGVYNTGTFSVTSDMKVKIPLSTISSNKAAIDGGGVFNSGTFSQSGRAAITTNEAGERGGGVYNSGTFRVSQAPSVKENTKTADKSANNVYLANNTVLEMTGDFSGEVYISYPAPAVRENANAADTSANDVPSENGMLLMAAGSPSEESYAANPVLENRNESQAKVIAIAAYAGVKGAENLISDNAMENRFVYIGMMGDTSVTWSDTPKEQYDIAVDFSSGSAENVSLSVTRGAENAYVTAVTDSGYRIRSDDVEIARIGQNEYGFVMPAAGVTVILDQPERSSSKSQGTSVWLTEEPTVAPTTQPAAEAAADVPGTPEAPSVKPLTAEQTQATQPGSSPAPVMGVIAGLGAGIAVFGLRMRR